MPPEKRGDKWGYRIEVYEGGKRRQVRKTGWKTKKEAVAAEQRHLFELANPKPAPSTLTVAALLHAWLKVHAPTLGPHTIRQYGSILRCHLLPAFGETRLAALSRREIQEWVAEAQKTQAVTSVRAHLAVLTSALSWAVDTEQLERHPALRIKLGKLPPADASGRALTEVEQARLLGEAEGTPLYLPTLIGLVTGLRVGEVLGLEWGCLDLEAGTLYVRQAVRRGAEGIELAPPKTPRSRRPVSLPPEVVEILHAHQATTTGSLLFPGPGGGLWRPDGFSRMWRRLCNRAELRIRFHDLRHSAASTALAGGVNIKAISRRLGHAGVTITLERYAHLMPGEEDQAARVAGESLERVLGHLKNGVRERSVNKEDGNASP